MCKIWELLGQYPRRNNLSKLATFDPIFQLPHSALFLDNKKKFKDIRNEIGGRGTSHLIADVFELLHHVRVHGGHTHGADDKCDAVHPVGFSWMILLASLAPVLSVYNILACWRRTRTKSGKYGPRALCSQFYMSLATLRSPRLVR